MHNKIENRKITDIELLRGIAILFVLIEHSKDNLFKLSSQFSDFIFNNFGGWTGVDLFFTISGFVIARELIPQLILNRAHPLPIILKFWLRRITRLWPSSWIWLMIILLLTVYFNQSSVYGELKVNLHATIAGIVNFANFRLIDTFGREPYGTSFPYWSLSLEEQFYFVLPMTVIVFRRWFPWILLTAFFLQLLCNRHFNLLLMLTRSDAIIFGVLLALWAKKSTYHRFEPTFLNGRPYLSISLFVTLIGLLAYRGSYHLEGQRYWVSAITIISGVLVFLASYDKNYLMPANPIKRIFIWLGSRSFGLYLIHIPVFFASREIWFRIDKGTPTIQNYNIEMGITAIILLLTLTELNYRFIESPLRFRGKIFAENLDLSPGWLKRTVVKSGI